MRSTSSESVGGDSTKGDVGSGKNIALGKNNRIENIEYETPITINNNSREAVLNSNYDAIRLALFGDTSLNFKGLIMRLDDLESQLRRELSELRRTLSLLESQVNELKRNLYFKNIHLLVSIINLFAILVALYILNFR